MLATLSLTFSEMAKSSTVLPPTDQQRVAKAAPAVTADAVLAVIRSG